MPDTVHFKDDIPRFKATFTDLTGTTADPDGVTFDAIDPSGNQTTYVYLTDAELVKDATGVYYVDFTLDEVGQFQLWFKATGTNAKSTVHYARVDTRP